MNELLFVVALVSMVQGAKVVGTATGFFYLHNKAIYFVTNRHVVVDESKGYRADELILRLHADPNDLTKNVERHVPLYAGGRPKWHVHPQYQKPTVDVAVIELDPAVVAGTSIKALSSANFLPERFVVTPGEDLMVIGFPRGLSDHLHNLPLIRNALISSAYGVEYEGAPTFLIDANMHPGMSGSPVLTKPKNIWPDKSGNTSMLTGTPTYFLGVFSATLSVTVSGAQEALGLGQVWYGRLIEEILDSVQK